MTALKIILGILALAAIAWLIYHYRWLINKIKTTWQFPIQDIGFSSMPAVPVNIEQAGATAFNLFKREQELKQAKIGLSNVYTIEGETASAYSFMYGDQEVAHRQQAFDDLHTKIKTTRLAYLRSSAALAVELKTNKTENNAPENPLTKLFLDKPEQFSMSWTTFGNVYQQAAVELLPKWAESLKSADAATEQFFPNLAKYGGAYNLLLTKKVTVPEVETYKSRFPEHWTDAMTSLAEKGLLYIIDLDTCFYNLQPQQKFGFDRFTPATFTWLEQDPTSKMLRPFAIHVSGNEGAEKQFYDREQSSDSAWLYAIQAAKVSVTVYGIWLGHVYHWHITTASMVMTMQENIPDGHSLYMLLEPHSTDLIGFNDILLLLWEQIAPPTSIKTAYQFLELTNTFSAGRTFFDDDPTITLQQLNIKKEDFTVDTDWDQYPIIGYLLQIWEYVGTYTDTFVNLSYTDDNQVAQDIALQKWISAASVSEKGNIRGLPEMNSRANLKKLLHSFLYRIVAHGLSRMNNTANPALTFVANFPPCLQQTLLPSPNSQFDTEELLRYLPNTGTIGEMMTFYYTFIYSAPYDSLIPIHGVDSHLFFPEGDERNKALIVFRQQMEDFIEEYTKDNAIPNIPTPEAQIHQWPLSVET